MTRPSALALPRRSGRGAPDRLLGFALAATAIRCVLRYVVLPFGLPLLGLAPGVADGVALAFDAAAVALAASAVWRLWSLGHRLRWRYLLLTCTMLTVVALLRLRDAAA